MAFVLFKRSKAAMKENQNAERELSAF